MLDPGETAPAFELPNQDGETVRLSDHRGERVVLYFYPRANTRGCTTEATGFRDEHAALRDLDAVVLGVSNDPTEDLRAFREEHDLPFDLLSDADGTVAERYDSYGTVELRDGTTEIAFRNTYVVGPDGEIERAYESVDPQQHPEDVLADLRSVTATGE
ncbi:peroxiredoxin [Halobacteriales archaeon SW_12_71_31]|nr:MAG: peroxiredoxin [Halobacteriales archaeon SW_12_71_31]